MKRCAVIGSINMDMVVATPRFPQPGETLTGTRFQTVPGGKGANQAIALARLGAPVRMAGRVGDDSFGRLYLDRFASCGVDVRAVCAAKGETTGVANILVSGQGENCIVIVPGANGGCDETWLEEALDAVMDCDIFLLQLEIPLKTVEKCVDRLRQAGKTILLDPAPAAPLSRELLSKVDYITPNETELRVVTSFLPEAAGMEERIRALTGAGSRVVHKRGGEGAYVGSGDGVVHVPGYSVKVVDTTAAGDTFNAGLAAGLAMGWDVERAVRLANAAGALAVTEFGAQEGMPDLKRAMALMEGRGDEI